MTKADRERYEQTLENQKRNATRWKGTSEQREEAQKQKEAFKESEQATNGKPARRPDPVEPSSEKHAHP